MLDIVFEDHSILVINKPTGVLSQPGKTMDGSVDTAVKQYIDQYDGPTLVHRLDMDTSGLMVFAKNVESHRCLHQQFERRLIQKRYTAVLVNVPTGLGGRIELPLMPDYVNRPRQKVAAEGKLSITTWQKIVAGGNRIHLYPLTGRTHQLRVVAASNRGLSSAILGDRLYGSSSLSDRLHLHADFLSLIHPTTSHRVHFKSSAPF